MTSKPSEISPAALPPTPDFLAAAESLGVVFDPGDLDRLGRYLALLLEANKTHNLTAITDPAEAWLKHILDSLTLVPLLSELLSPLTAHRSPVALSVVDLGSGGGVPGIPLAIVLPDLHFTLVEATGKKAEFLHQTAAALGLTNVTVLNTRAERLGHEEAHREHHDAAIARALGHLAVIAELATPLIRPQALVLAVKGAKADQEIAEARQAMSLLKCHHQLTQHTPTGRIVVLRKDAATPSEYPRRDGEPKRKPLGL